MVAIDLSDKVALITGGGQGLGAAIGALLHQAGARVAVSYLPDAAGDNQRRAAETCAPWGERGTCIPADVRRAADCRQLIEAVIGQFGKLDLLINNAGIIRDKTVRKLAEDDWAAVIDTNLSGTFRMCKEAAEVLSADGRIVSLSSISATVGLFGQANYAAAKAGVIGLTKVLSRELAKRQITVNAIAPGVVDAGMGLTIPEPLRSSMLSQIPLGRFASPEEIAGVVLFLCSQFASYVTGQTIHINGGWWSSG